MNFHIIYVSFQEHNVYSLVSTGFTMNKRVRSPARSLYKSLPLNIAKHITFFLYPHRLDYTDRFRDYLAVYPLCYFSVSLRLIKAVDDCHDSFPSSIEAMLNWEDCPTIDIYLESFDESTIEFIKPFLRSQRVEAVTLCHMSLSATAAMELVSSFEHAKNKAHLLRVMLTESSNQKNDQQEEQVSTARIVAELVARDKKLIYLWANESRLELSGGTLVKSGLLDSLKATSSLCYLFIRDVGLDSEGAVLLGSVLEEQRTIVSLDITCNEVGDRGIVAFANCLKKNTALRLLCLGSCKASSVAGCAVAEALEVNNTLDLLYMSDDDLGAASGYAFAAMLKKNSTLRRLHLDYCDLEAEGCRAFIAALAKNRSLKHLTLNCCGISEFDKTELVRVAEKHRVLEILEVAFKNELTSTEEVQCQYTASGAYWYSSDTNYARHLSARDSMRDIFRV